jgi:hypothetical protein
MEVEPRTNNTELKTRCYWECFGEHIGNFGGAFLRTQWEHVENMMEQTPQNKNKKIKIHPLTPCQNHKLKKIYFQNCLSPFLAWANTLEPLETGGTYQYTKTLTLVCIYTKTLTLVCMHTKTLTLVCMYTKTLTLVCIYK